MAIRLLKAFGSPPETWLRIQLAYDLVQAQKRREQDLRYAASMHYRNFTPRLDSQK